MSDLDHLARTVREWNERQANVAGVTRVVPESDQQVAVVQRRRVDANANLVVPKGHQRPLDDPELLQSEGIDLCDEIRLLLRRTHLRLHAVAVNKRWTLRRASSAKKLPSVDATFREWKSLTPGPRGTFPRVSSRETVHSKADDCSSQVADPSLSS